MKNENKRIIFAVCLFVFVVVSFATLEPKPKPPTTQEHITRLETKILTLETWASQVTPEVNINSHMTRGEQGIYFNEIADSRCYQCHTGGK